MSLMKGYSSTETDSENANMPVFLSILNDVGIQLLVVSPKPVVLCEIGSIRESSNQCLPFKSLSLKN